MNDLRFKVISLKSASQKNNNFHATLDNGESYTFHANSIIRYSIRENKVIESRILYQALEHTEREQIKNKIIVLLSYRQRSKKELTDTFVSKGYKIENVLNVIDKLEQRKYIDESLFIKMMASHWIKEKKLGRFLVEQKLFQHGIDSSLMEPIISDLYKRYPASKTIKEILDKKKKTLEYSLKNKVKIVNLLKRKGFQFDDINPIIESLNI